MTPDQENAPDPSPLHDRMRQIAGQRSYRVLADLTGHHVETVRRYMLGQGPSIEFVSALCKAFDVSADWMLTGRGAMHAKEARNHTLRTSSPGELLAAVAGALERLTDRVDRIEKYVQTLETRLRAHEATGEPASGAQTPGAQIPGAQTPSAHAQQDSKQPPGVQPHAPQPKANAVVRALWIAGAVPERSRPDAG